MSQLFQKFIQSPQCPTFIQKFHNKFFRSTTFKKYKFFIKTRSSSLKPIFTPNHTRNSSGDEIANVNFLYDDIVHVLQNTIDSWINSATDRRGGYVLERMFTKFSEITQSNGHYAVQGHSRSPILVPIESSYIRLPISDEY